MNSRRNFLQISLAAAVVSMVGPSVVKASGPQFPGVIYTSENEGKWAGKAGSHAPEIEISGRTVRIRTIHPMSMEHYIVRHTLVLENGQVVGEKTFDPAKDKQVESTHELPAGYTGRIIATSFCNQHDFWLTDKQV